MYSFFALPVGTTKNTSHRTAPLLRHSFTISGRSCRLKLVTVVFICSGMPTSFAVSIIFMLVSNVPFTPLNVSCISALLPSMLIAILDTPLSFSFSILSLVARGVPLKATATLILELEACSSISKRSSLIRGSPPVTTTRG